MVAVRPLQQSEPPRPLSTELHQDDWGVRDWSALWGGQLGVVRRPSRSELHVYRLRVSAVRSFPSRVQSETPAFQGNCFLVSSLGSSAPNRLGGQFSSFQSLPSTARVAVRRWPDQQRALTLDFAKASSGFGGMWVQLFDSSRPPQERIYFNAAPFSVLTFWARGARGDERVLLKISDAQWARREDALAIGNLGQFTRSGRLQSDWQQVVVPLASLPRPLNDRELAGLVFEASGAGQGRIGVKDLAFCKETEPLPPLSPPISSRPGTVSQGKALWVWNTAEILSNAGQQQELLEFASTQRVSHLFLQLPNEPENLGPDGEIRLQVEKVRTLLSLLNRHGLHVYALDGSKSYALPNWHRRVLMTVDQVVRYNQRVTPGERFSGVHYDIEPYLLPGFSGPRRERILQNYLELLGKIAEKTRAAGLAFGVDIPFWYDTPDELTGEVGRVEFSGALKFASQHVMDLVDEASIMAYRTSAYGADGVLALAQDEIEYAAQTGKKVFVGLETTDIPDEELVEFEGRAERGIPTPPPSGHCVVLLAGSSSAKLWLVAPKQWSGLLEELRPGSLRHQSLFWWPVRRTILVPAHKLTFATLGAGRLHETMEDALEELQRFPSFAGYAIHDYLGYRRLLAKTSSH